MIRGLVKPLARSIVRDLVLDYEFALNLDFTSTLPSGETFTRASNGTYVNSSGVIATASTDAARIDYNPATLEAKGLLIEGARAKLILESDTLTSANWSKLSATLTANATTAPDGASTADLLTADVATAIHRILFDKGGFLTVGQIYTVSWFVKAAGHRYFRTWWGGTGVGARFDLQTGTVDSLGSTISATITDIGGGFFFITNTYTAANADSVRLYLLGNQTSDSWLGDGQGLYLWRAGVELGSFASSSAATTTTAVTRAVDSCIRSSTAFSDNWNAAAMTVVLKFDSPGIGTRTVWQTDDTSADERYSLYTDGTTLKLKIVDGGSTVCDLSANGAITANTPQYCAIRVEANNIAVSLNGSAVATDTSAALPTVTRRVLGASTVAGEELFGHIAREWWVKEALPDSTVRALAAAGGPA